jgi:hypothetical protein
MSTIVSLMKIMMELLWPWLLMTVRAAASTSQGQLFQSKADDGE